MNKEETVLLLTMLKTSCPKFVIPETEKEMDIQIDTWYTLFENEDFNIIKQATYQVIKTVKFAPCPADIADAVCDIKYGAPMSEQEAINMMMDHIVTATERWTKAFNTLPSILQKIAGTPEQMHDWSRLDFDTVQTVVASSIQRSYRQLVAEEYKLKKTGQYIEPEIIEYPEKNEVLTEKQRDEFDDEQKGTQTKEEASAFMQIVYAKNSKDAEIKAGGQSEEKDEKNKIAVIFQQMYANIEKIQKEKGWLETEKAYGLANPSRTSGKY